MKRDGQVAETVEEPDQSGKRAPVSPKMWPSKDVADAALLAILLFAAIWVGVSSGTDYVHVGRSECVFSHDRFSHMDVQCGTEPIGNTGAATGNSGVVSGDTGAPLTNTAASVDNPTTPEAPSG